MKHWGSGLARAIRRGFPEQETLELCAEVEVGGKQKKGEKIIPSRGHSMCKGPVAGGSLVKDVDGEVGRGYTRADPVTHVQGSCLYCKNKGKPGRILKKE